MREHANNLDVLYDLLHLRCWLCRGHGLIRAVDTDGRPYGLRRCGSATANFGLRVDNAADGEFRKAWDARVTAVGAER